MEIGSALFHLLVLNNVLTGQRDCCSKWHSLLVQ